MSCKMFFMEDNINILKYIDYYDLGQSHVKNS